jgi:hypothetical protein
MNFHVPHKYCKSGYVIVIEDFVAGIESKAPSYIHKMWNPTDFNGKKTVTEENFSKARCITYNI